MKKKNIIFIGIIVSILLLISLIGTTFAYYIAKISGTPSTTNVSGNTGNLALTYTPLNITVSDILPGWTLEKNFTVKNTSTADKSLTYDLILQNISNTFTRQQDIVFKITCKSSSGTCLGSGTKIGTSGDGTTELQFPASDVTLFTSSSIPKGVTHTYSIYFRYKNEATTDQQADMLKSFKTTVTISSNGKYTY